MGSLDVTDKNFQEFDKELDGPLTIFGTIAASTARTYSLTGASDGYPPRGIICHSSGDFICTDWEDNACTIPVIQGQYLYVMPKTISVSNAVAFSEGY